MAEGLNRVMLFGNLCADPEFRTTQGGTGVLNLRIATNERYQDANKEWKDRVEYHRVVVWGKRGEGLSRILAKGSAVFVEGSLRTSSYEKNGEKRYSTDVVAQNVILAGGKRERSDSVDDAPARAPAQRTVPEWKGTPSQGDAYEGDDPLPF